MTQLIIANNDEHNYQHFNNFKSDNQKPGISRNLDIVRVFLKWSQVIWKNKHVLIHYNYPFEIKSIIRDTPFILFARFLDRKLIVHVHGGKYLTNDPPRWLNVFLKMIFRKDQPVIVLSEAEKAELTQRYGLDKVFILPNCVGLSDARHFDRGVSNRKALNLLFLGRIDENKGLGDILNALKLLDEKQINYNFILAGKGPSQEKYVNNFSALAGSRFIFKGVISGTQKSDLFKNCDLFLLPSLFEGLPMALLESMSFGVVPLVTDAGSMLTVVTHEVNGLVIPKHAPAEIASAIENLHTDRQLLYALAKKSQITIVQRFNISDHLSNLNQIYRSI